jgi:hypothetical protein
MIVAGLRSVSAIDRMEATMLRRMMTYLVITPTKNCENVSQRIRMHPT